MLRRAIRAVPALMALFWAIPLGAAGFRVALTENAVVTFGVIPKGQIILLGVTREIGEDDFPTVRRHLEVLTDDDGDGVVRFPVGTKVPLRSLWVVADLASGDYDAVAPDDFGLRRVDWRGGGLRRRLDGKDAVEDRRSLLELLVVRPKVGAWAARLRDGGDGDADGRIDGRLEGLLDKLKPVAGEAAPPAVLQRGDLVLALDPLALEVTLVKVDKSL